MAYIEPPHKDQILSLLKESKRLERKEKFLEALSVLDRISHLHESKLIDFSLSTALTKQIATLCNRLVITVPSKVPYLRRAEQTLTSWILMMHNSKAPMNEKIYRILLLTFNNWATYYQSTKNYHMTLSYLMRGLKLIEDFEIKEPDSFEYVAKTQLNVCALYSELRRYSDAILYAEECLKTLQFEVKLRLSNKDFSKLESKEKAKAESMFVTYVIAFYNIGVAEEYLNHKESMYQAFKNAVDIGIPFLPPDNEFLISAKKALNEAQIFKNKSFTPNGVRSSIRIPPEQLAQKIKKHTKNKYSLTIHKAEKKLTKLETLKTDEKKKIGRYYSDAQLKKIQEKMEIEDKANFVSVDQYFYREISKLMNVKSDVQFLRPLTTSGAMNLWDKQDEEKMKITGLREKKKKIKVGEFIRHKISEKIQKMKEMDDQLLKKHEIKLKSKMKTKVYKHLLRAITDRTYNYTFPPQRLCFKPPLSHLRRCSSEVILSSVLTTPEEISKKEVRVLNLQNTKDDIEKMMDRITTEIRNIDIEKGTCKAQSPDLFFRIKIKQDNHLAKSAQKKTQEKKSKTMEKAINNSFKPKKNIKKSLSPMVLLRANTLINYQV